MNERNEKLPTQYPLWLRGLLSAVIVLHLSIIIMLANGPSILGRLYQGWVLGYANQLGLNQTWNFFSPDPTHVHYLEYTLSFEAPDEKGNRVEDIVGSLPEEKTQIVLDSSKRRMLHAIRYMSLDPTRTEKLLAPFFCRKHPTASHLRIQHIMNLIPPLDRAALFADRPLHELMEEVPYRTLDFECSHYRDSQP